MIAVISLALLIKGKPMNKIKIIRGLHPISKERVGHFFHEGNHLGVCLPETLRLSGARMKTHTGWRFYLQTNIGDLDCGFFDTQRQIKTKLSSMIDKLNNEATASQPSR